MRAVGLRTYVWNNQWRAILLLAGFPLLLTLIGYAVALLAVAGNNASISRGMAEAAALLPAIMPLALLASGIWFAIAWRFNQAIIDLLSGASPVTREAEPRLWNLLENLCISRGMAMPRLAVIETEARNAFASGLSREKGAVTVTRGLLAALDDRELEAVLAHELTHIRNGDARLAVIAAVFAGIISMVAELMFRGMRFSGQGRRRDSSSSRDRGNAGALILIALVIAGMAWTLAIALRFALSRNREFLADAGAVELTRDPDAMILALRRISGHSEMPKLPAQLQAMLLDSPAEALGSQLLATHPPLEERVAALVRYAGGHDPGPLAAPEAPAAAPETPAAEGDEPPAAAAPETPEAGQAPGSAAPNPWGAVSGPLDPARPWWRR